MNILVTGATGFIGRAFIHTLAQHPHNIFGLALKKNDPDFDYSLVKDFFVQDISQPFKIPGSFDWVFHLAALNITHVGKIDAQAYHRVNIQGTENFLKAVTAKKIVFMSTAKVYRRQERIDESSDILPENDYERSKWMGEKVCRRYLKPDQLVVLRPVNIVGPGQADKAVLPVFLKNAIQNQPLDIFAPRDSVLQFVYIDDVIRLFEALLKNNAASGVFNISSTDRISLEDLALKILELTHSRSAVRFTSAQKAVFSEVLSSRAKEVLNWQAEVSIEEILRRYCTDFVRI